MQMSEELLWLSTPEYYTGGGGWMTKLHLYSILDMTLVLLLMFIIFFSTLELSAACSVFFQQYEFGLCLCTLQGSTGAAVSHPHS